MFHMRLARMPRVVVAGLIAAGAAVSLMATPASAGPIGVDAGCKFVLASVKANTLQEANADEIYMKIGNDYTKTVKFREGETHLASEFGSAAQTTEFIAVGGSIVVSVFEADWPSQDEHLGSFSVFCNPIHDSEPVTGFGSNYDVVLDVVVA
ncbi:MAG TPA: hypothetical protein VFC19_07105 [Candidatus Limnocylindrales bacterium]|nr:hypothetical protein [Candidatus Limnocylindrales bacterium]